MQRLVHKERPIHNKFDFKDFNSKCDYTNYVDRSTGSDSSHMSQIGVLGSWEHETSDS